MNFTYEDAKQKAAEKRGFKSWYEMKYDQRSEGTFWAIPCEELAARLFAEEMVKNDRERIYAKRIKIQYMKKDEFLNEAMPC